jgi:ADP-ribose pyrophosphatase YjhB (NUDIX family)
MLSQNVAVIVLNAQTREVLLRRQGFRAWSLPGGQMEAGETWEAAAVRKALEATGYRIEVERLVGRYWRSQWPEGDELTYVALARILSDAPHALHRETPVTWFPIMALPRSLNRFGRVSIADAVSEYPFAVQRPLDVVPHEALLFRLWRLISRLFKR